MRTRGRVNGKLLVMCALLVVATVSSSFRAQPAYADQITNRTLTLETGGTGDGGSEPGGVVNHQFDFTVPTAGNIGSIQFEYCTTASNPSADPDICTMPTGLITTSAIIGNEDTSQVSGFSIVTNTVDAPNGSYYLTRAAAPVAAGATVSLQIDDITNPTTTNQAFFVRISTYPTTDITGPATDTGTVAATTATQIVLSGTMPESLIFCTGGTIDLNGGGIPDCSTASSGAVTFNQLFSPSDTATATSQMAASTNAATGYSITVAGPTLTSGVNTIPAMSSATTGVEGQGQFGMNLKLNTTATSTVAVGAEVAPASNGTDLRGQASGDYATVDTFKFAPGETVAASDFNTPGPTNAQIFTVSYIVNVAGSQPAGTYVSTLTYVCTATF